MRTTALLIFTVLSLAACGKGSEQARALDRAADQADPAAAAAMHNEADAIRASGSDANLSDPNSPAQAAMANAGAAAAGTPAGTPKDRSFGTRELVAPAAGPSDRRDVPAAVSSAKPHKAGEPVPNAPKPR